MRYRSALRQVAVILLLGSVIECESSPESQERYNLIAARTACREFVKQRLKAPSTAKFQRTEPPAVRTGPTAFRVSGEYDAQNGFGAMLRGMFECELEEGAEHWKLASIAMTP